jgi:hypothetical protein
VCVSLVEGKGFVLPRSISVGILEHHRLHNRANRDIPSNLAQRERPRALPLPCPETIMPRGAPLPWGPPLLGPHSRSIPTRVKREIPARQRKGAREMPLPGATAQGRARWGSNAPETMGCEHQPRPIATRRSL